MCGFAIVLDLACDMCGQDLSNTRRFLPRVDVWCQCILDLRQRAFRLRHCAYIRRVVNVEPEPLDCKICEDILDSTIVHLARSKLVMTFRICFAVFLFKVAHAHGCVVNCISHRPLRDFAHTTRLHVTDLDLDSSSTFAVLQTSMLQSVYPQFLKIHTLFPTSSRLPMSENRITLTRATSSNTTTSTSCSSSAPACDNIEQNEPVHLPDEIILDILSYLPPGEQSQGSLWACCLLSRQWYV
jgi:hypothetical protein